MSIVPMPYRILALVLLAGAVWGHGFLKGDARKQAQWDAVVQQEKLDAAELAAIQARAMMNATAAHAAREAEDARKESARRRFIDDVFCGGVRDEPAGLASVPAVPAGRPGADTGTRNRKAAAVANDIAVTCPEIRRRAMWLRDLAIAAGADKK